MGKHFGNLVKLKGVTFYCLSPNELKPFKGMINPGFMNMVRRTRESFFFVTIPMVYAYIVYSFGQSEYYRVNRKNPDDYKNDA